MMMPRECERCGLPLDADGYCTDECEDTDKSLIDEPDYKSDPDAYWDDRNEPRFYG